jgi:stearoyl-CoA desaturase (delta-9 desaturase)
LFRLARVRRLAPRAVSTRGRHLIDRDTVRAVVSQRFYILKRYGQIVVRPALREARRNTDRMGRRLIQRAKALMTREDIPADPKSAETIERVLKQDKTLATIYHFRQQLKEIWSRGRAGQPGRVERLQAWCAASEQSGIRALEEFAQFLRGYRLQPA